MAKVKKTFRLSSEAVAKLNMYPNATKHLEQLILGTSSTNYIMDELKIISFKLDELMPKPEPLSEVQSDELACCKRAKPCKHWQYSGISSEWINSLTGAVMDI